MGKIDTSRWKKFRVGELFAAERGKVKNIQPLCPGETPIIAAGAYNQGIAGIRRLFYQNGHVFFQIRIPQRSYP